MDLFRSHPSIYIYKNCEFIFMFPIEVKISKYYVYINDFRYMYLLSKDVEEMSEHIFYVYKIIFLSYNINFLGWDKRLADSVLSKVYIENKYILLKMRNNRDSATKTVYLHSVLTNAECTILALYMIFSYMNKKANVVLKFTIYTLAVLPRCTLNSPILSRFHFPS